MKTANVFLFLAGLAAGAYAAEEAQAGPVVNAVIKRISTVVTVSQGDASLMKRDEQDCLRAASSLQTVAEEGTSITFPQSLVPSLASYARNQTNSGAIVAGCGSVTSSGQLSSEYAKFTSSANSWFATASPAFQQVNYACGEIDEVQDALSSAFALLSDCPSQLAAATGTDKIEPTNAASPRQTGAALAAVGIAGMVIAAM